MNIKSLLIGSAAALVAVSGARAADAVMAEPEPVEYVKVCDAYGAGFFYIPGTETCLQISGLVWFQVGAGSLDGDDNDTPTYHYGEGRQDGFVTTSNIRLNIDARSETELGTLRSYIRFQPGDFNGYNGSFGSDGSTFIDQAYIQLGGFTMGYTESLFEGAIGPYGMSYAGYGSSSWDGLYYGYQERNLAAYVYKSGTGLFAGISLEDDGYPQGDFIGGDDDNNGYIPDVVGLLAYEQAWGGVFITAGYDESADGFGVKAGGQYNFAGSWVRVVGSYADSNNDYNVEAPGFGNGYEFTILGEFGHKFSDKLTVSVAGQYFANAYTGFVGSDDEDDDIDAWAAELNVVYSPVQNFEIRTEIVYQDIDADDDGRFGDPDGSVSGFLRFTRYF